MSKVSDERPRHEQIAADIRAQIMSGDLPRGTQLPSTPQLVARYEAANATIQKALKALKDEGFLTSHMGKGVYVHDRQALIVPIANYLDPSPGGYEYQLLDVREIAASLEVTEALQLVDEAVVLRHRLLLHAGSPIELSWSYYPASIAWRSELAKSGRIRGGAPRVLTELGYPQLEMIDRVSSRMPTTYELELLELPPNVPVTRQFRLITSTGGQPVEASVLVKGGNRAELQYRLSPDTAA